jgi:hypothetical protein
MSNTGKKRGNGNGHRNENKKTSKTPQTQTEIQPQQISEDQSTYVYCCFNVVTSRSTVDTFCVTDLINVLI